MALRTLKRTVAKHRMKQAGQKWDRDKWKDFLPGKRWTMIKGIRRDK